ncbi:hypothetical protein [Nodosilinea nodulosa]|uniref:hypothetical protein n=1 Tax=Nodosilinea nodulosa TaxID=416001 RepID=UPI0002E0BF3B|nr:hypothetical protein [Nodosilinea nodulosa]
MNLLTAPRLNQLLITFRQPQWIAAIVSLGFHGALFAASPSFSSLNMAALGGTSPELEERRVPLIELTPEEQNRLPNFSASPYSLSPGNNGDLFSLFPPSGDSLPLEPGSDFGASIKIPAPQIPSNSFPTGISPYTSPGRSTFRLSPRRSALTPIPGVSDLGGRSAPSTPNSTPRAASTPATTISGDDDAPRAADLDIHQNNSEDNAANSTPRSTSSSALNTNTPGDEQVNDLLARVEFSDAQTNAADVEKAKAEWLESVKAKLGDSVAEAPNSPTIEVPYSGRLCLNPEPTDGLLGVVGVPDESTGLNFWTTVLKSTGYPFLNEAAQQAVQELQQQEDTEESPLTANTLYQVVVEIGYDKENCVSRETLLHSRTSD